MRVEDHVDGHEQGGLLVGWLLVVALAAGLVLTIVGMRESGLFAKSLWMNPRASAIGAGVLFIAVLALERLASRRGWSFTMAAAIAGAALAAGFAGPGSVVVVLLQMAAAFSLGRRILPMQSGEDLMLNAVLATAVGTALFSWVVGWLAFLPINTPPLYLALLVVPLVWGGRENLEVMRLLLTHWSTPVPAGVGWWKRAFDFTVVLACFLNLLAVLHPEIGSDALGMHLVIADLLRTETRFHYDVTRAIWAVMPMGGDWQYGIANMLGGQPAARLANMTAAVLSLVMLQRWTTTVAGSPLAGSIAAALYASLPLFYLETTSLFVENFWTFWVLGALALGQASIASVSTREAVASGICLGGALAAKLMTLFAGPFFLAIVLAWAARRSLPLAKLGWVVAGFVVLGCWPYINAWWRTGNPVFPFQNNIFKSAFFDASAPFTTAMFHEKPGMRTLYDLTFRSGNFIEGHPGALGIALMLLVPMALLFALTKNALWRTLAICSLIFIVAVFTFQSYARYIVPMLPLIFAMAAAALMHLRRVFPAIGTAAMGAPLAAAAAGLFLTPTSNFHHRQITVPPTAGSPAENAYLDQMRPERRLARVLDDLGLQKVLWIGSAYYAGSHTDVRTTNWHGGWAQVGEFNALQDESQLRRWLARHRFDAIVVTGDQNVCARKFICDFLEQHATKRFEQGPMAVHVIDPSILFANELLTNTGFDGGTTGWVGDGKFLLQDGVVEVTATHPFTQAVVVQPGRRYAVEAEGRCAKGSDAAFRVQINWLDKSGALIGADADPIPCTTDFTTHHKIVEAPAAAAQGIVYATGHLPDGYVEITRVSMRQ